MRSDQVFVTGEVGVIPGTKKAAQVKAAFEQACGRRGATIYVLGHLFAPDTKLDDMITYMDNLPGRKCLVVEGMSKGSTEWNERRLGGWHNTGRYLKLDEWGMKFQLSPDVFPFKMIDGILIHAEKREDNGQMINARWDAFDGRFGPAGLHSLYALGILATQYATGFVEPEPVDGS